MASNEFKTYSPRKRHKLPCRIYCRSGICESKCLHVQSTYLSTHTYTRTHKYSQILTRTHTIHTKRLDTKNETSCKVVSPTIVSGQASQMYTHVSSGCCATSQGSLDWFDVDLSTRPATFKLICVSSILMIWASLENVPAHTYIHTMCTCVAM